MVPLAKLTWQFGLNTTMIPFPKQRTSDTPLPGALDVNLDGTTPHLLVEASVHPLTLESLISDPEAMGRSLSVGVRPPKFSLLSAYTPAQDYIKYECPPTGLRVKLYELQNSIRIIGDRKARAYRSKRIAYIKQVRRELSRVVPVKHAYVPEKVTKTVTYYRRLKVPVSSGLLAGGWVDTLNLTYEQVQKIQAMNEAAGPFAGERSRNLKVRVTKTFTYVRKVRIPVEFKRINPPKEVVNARMAQWIRINPPYSRRSDPELLRLRAERAELKLQLAQYWNQCLAVKRRGTFRWRATSPGGEKVVETNPLPLIPTLSRVYSHATRLNYSAIFGGYSAIGRPNHLGFAVGWEPDSTAPSEWTAKVTWSKALSYDSTGRPTDEATLHAFHGQPAWSMIDVVPQSSAYADAMLSLASGDIHETERFRIVRSVGELKDTRLTVRSAREFLKWILGSKAKAVTTVSTAAAAFLTYKFGIQPTAEDVGRLLGASRDLMMRTDDVLAEVSRAARLLGKQLFSVRKYVRFDSREAVEKNIFDPNPPPLVWRSEILTSSYSSGIGYRKWDVPMGLFHGGGPNPGQLADLPVHLVGSDPLLGGELNPRFKARLPQFVWLPRKPLAFCRYKTENVKAALDGTNIMDYYGSIIPIWTAWELTPLSFVVDWFFTTNAVARNLDRFLQAAYQDLVATEDGFWHSTPMDLYLVLPKWDNPSHEVVTQFRGTPQGYAWDSSKGCRRVTSYASVTVEELTPLHYAGADWLKTGCAAYTRGPLDVHPALALMPRLRVMLNRGKVGSLVALLGLSLK